MKEELPYSIAIHCISFRSETKRRRFLKDWNDDESLIEKRDKWFEKTFKKTIAALEKSLMGTSTLKREAMKVCPLPTPKCGENGAMCEFYLDEHCLYWVEDKKEIAAVLKAMEAANIKMDEFFTEENVYTFCGEIAEECPELFDAIDDPTEDCYPLLIFVST